MKSLNCFLLALCTCMLLISCNKNDDPLTVVEQPQFVTTGIINGNALTITTGVNGYVMRSSQQYDTSTAVAEFHCDLEKENCSPCANSLHFTLRNNVHTLQNENINSVLAFSQAYYPLRNANGNPFHFDLQFNAKTSTSFVDNVKWIFGDGNISNQLNIIHTYEFPGVYTAALIVNYSSGCTDTLINTFRIALPGSICKSRFSMIPTGGNTINFSNQSLGTGALTYLWNFGDGATSTQQSPSHTYPAGVEKYIVSLKVTDAANHVSIFKQHLITGSTMGCLANFQFPQITEVANPSALANVTIEWNDANGIAYSSLNGVQPDESFLKIVSVEDLPDAANGEHQKKLHLQFTCRVFDAQQNYLDLNTMDAMLVMVYR